MKKIKESKSWKFYSNYRPRKGYLATNIKRGKIDKNYWEYILKTPKGKKKHVYTNAYTHEGFKENVRDKAYKRL